MKDSIAPFVYYGTNTMEEFILFIYNNLRVFSGLDRNNDGKISFIERVRAIPPLVTAYASSSLYKNEKEFIREFLDLTAEEMSKMAQMVIANFPDLKLTVHVVEAQIKSALAFRVSLIALHKSIGLAKVPKADLDAALAEVKAMLARFDMDDLRVVSATESPLPVAEPDAKSLKGGKLSDI